MAKRTAQKSKKTIVNPRTRRVDPRKGLRTAQKVHKKLTWQQRFRILRRKLVTQRLATIRRKKFLLKKTAYQSRRENLITYQQKSLPKKRRRLFRRPVQIRIRAIVARVVYAPRYRTLRVSRRSVLNRKKFRRLVRLYKQTQSRSKRNLLRFFRREYRYNRRVNYYQRQHGRYRKVNSRLAVHAAQKALSKKFVRIYQPKLSRLFNLRMRLRLKPLAARTRGLFLPKVLSFEEKLKKIYVSNWAAKQLALQVPRPVMFKRWIRATLIKQRKKFVKSRALLRGFLRYKKKGPLVIRLRGSSENWQRIKATRLFLHSRVRQTIREQVRILRRPRRNKKRPKAKVRWFSRAAKAKRKKKNKNLIRRAFKKLKASRLPRHLRRVVKFTIKRDVFATKNEGLFETLLNEMLGSDEQNSGSTRENRNISKLYRRTSKIETKWRKFFKTQRRRTQVTPKYKRSHKRKSNTVKKRRKGRLPHRKNRNKKALRPQHKRRRKLTIKHKQKNHRRQNLVLKKNYKKHFDTFKRKLIFFQKYCIKAAALSQKYNLASIKASENLLSLISTSHQTPLQLPAKPEVLESRHALLSQCNSSAKVAYYNEKKNQIASILLIVRQLRALNRLSQRSVARQRGKHLKQALRLRRRTKEYRNFRARQIKKIKKIRVIRRIRGLSHWRLMFAPKKIKVTKIKKGLGVRQQALRKKAVRRIKNKQKSAALKTQRIHKIRVIRRKRRRAVRRRRCLKRVYRLRWLLHQRRRYWGNWRGRVKRLRRLRQQITQELEVNPTHPVLEFLSRKRKPSKNLRLLIKYNNSFGVTYSLRVLTCQLLAKKRRSVISPFARWRYIDYLMSSSWKCENIEKKIKKQNENWISAVFRKKRLARAGTLVRIGTLSRANRQKMLQTENQETIPPAALTAFARAALRTRMHIYRLRRQKVQMHIKTTHSRVFVSRKRMFRRKISRAKSYKIRGDLAEERYIGRGTLWRKKNLRQWGKFKHDRWSRARRLFLLPVSQEGPCSARARFLRFPHRFPRGVWTHRYRDRGYEKPRWLKKSWKRRWLKTYRKLAFSKKSGARRKVKHRRIFARFRARARRVRLLAEQPLRSLQRRQSLSTQRFSKKTRKATFVEDSLLQQFVHHRLLSFRTAHTPSAEASVQDTRLYYTTRHTNDFKKPVEVKWCYRPRRRFIFQQPRTQKWLLRVRKSKKNRRLRLGLRLAGLLSTVPCVVPRHNRHLSSKISRLRLRFGAVFGMSAIRRVSPKLSPGYVFKPFQAQVSPELQRALFVYSKSFKQKKLTNKTLYQICAYGMSRRHWRFVMRKSKLSYALYEAAVLQKEQQKRFFKFNALSRSQYVRNRRVVLPQKHPRVTILRQTRRHLRRKAGGQSEILQKNYVEQTNKILFQALNNHTLFLDGKI